MKNLSTPFIIGYPNPKDYVLKRVSGKKPGHYHLRIPAEKRLIKPLIITFGKAAQNLNLNLQIEIGKRAEAVIKILTNATGTQRLNINAELLCSETQSKGELVMKGVARDHATLNFEGLVHIGKRAVGTSAHLKQEILNLSPYTSVHAKPSLKIATNDVKAGHSANIRNLNDEDLYYFAARGIESETAKKLLIDGFFEDEQKIF